ncbi:type IV conjugative transfer system protein TraE [Providencia rettgeri]
MKLSAAKSAHKFTSLVFIILVCLLGGSITGNILAWSNIATLIDSREMTYIPQFFETPFTLSRSHADANYLEQTAQSLIFLRYNVSPESVKANHKALLRFFDNGQRPQMQELLAEEAKQIIENNVTSAFYLSGMDVYPHSGIVDIHGDIQTWIGNRKSLPERVTLRLTLKYANGLTTIGGFEVQVDEKKKK